MKEAYLKARGLGIAVPLADLSFRLAPEPVTLICLNSLAGEHTTWAFALDELSDCHFVAAAAPVANGDHPRFVVEPFPDDLWL